jgi:dolichol kinase
VPVPSFLLRVSGGGGGGGGRGDSGKGSGDDDNTGVSGVTTRSGKRSAAGFETGTETSKGDGGGGDGWWGELAVGAALDAFMSRFTDARDGGESGIILSHFSLLLGLAVPLWITQEAWDGGSGGIHGSAAAAGAGARAGAFVLSPFAGIITLGLGDTAASVVGVTLGRHKICRGWHKSIEGTLASACANLVGARAVWGVVVGGGLVPWTCIVAASVGAAALEAVTAQLDNAFLPLHFVALAQLTAAL